MKWNIHDAANMVGKMAIQLHKLKAFEPRRVLNFRTENEMPSPDGIRGEFFLGLKTTGLDLTQAMYLSMQSHEGGNAALLSTFLLSEVFGEGPKVFKLGNVDFEALEATKVNIPILEYNQPFRTIVFEYPDDYATKRRVPCEQGGEHNELIGITYPEDHSPSFCVIHHAKEINCLMAGLYCTSSQLYTAKFNAAEKTLEECLDLESKEICIFDKSAPTNDSEFQMFHNALRAAFNAALLLDEIGCHKVGPENPAYHERLQRYLKKAKTQGGERLESAIRELQVHPTIYELDQHVELRDTIRADPLEEREGGYTVIPHHRRGHYRQQPYGPGLTMRKRVRIKPVFVNAHLFNGDFSKTKVTYSDE